MKSYKKEFRSYINFNKQASTVISIHPSQLYVNSNEMVWEDDNKEVFYHGKLYDVINVRSGGASVLLEVLSDDKEQEMKKEFADSNNGFSKNGSSGLMKILKQFLALKYISQDNIFSLNNYGNSNVLFQEFDFNLFRGCFSSLYHPPETLI